jgi:sugar/nucleoside kinase (ribokinase family)
VRDVTGAGDSYSGGFNVGLAETADPLEAALRGAVSASIIVENIGALNSLDVNPNLAEARLNSLRESIRKL